MTHASFRGLGHAHSGGNGVDHERARPAVECGDSNPSGSVVEVDLMPRRMTAAPENDRGLGRPDRRQIRAALAHHIGLDLPAALDGAATYSPTTWTLTVRSRARTWSKSAK